MSPRERARRTEDILSELLARGGAGTVRVQREPQGNVILLDGAAEEVSADLLRQLKDGGRLLGVVGRPPLSKAMLFRSTGGESSSRHIFDATAPALPGFAKPPAFVF